MPVMLFPSTVGAGGMIGFVSTRCIWWESQRLDLQERRNPGWASPWTGSSHCPPMARPRTATDPNESPGPAEPLEVAIASCVKSEDQAVSFTSPEMSPRNRQPGLQFKLPTKEKSRPYLKIDRSFQDLLYNQERPVMAQAADSKTKPNRDSLGWREDDHHTGWSVDCRSRCYTGSIARR